MKRAEPEEGEESPEEEVEQKPVKKAKEKEEEKPAAQKETDDMIEVNENCISEQLDSRRRIQVKEFKGKLYVDIREFYSADGELKPTKKGGLREVILQECFCLLTHGKSWSDSQELQMPRSPRMEKRNKLIFS